MQCFGALMQTPLGDYLPKQRMAETRQHLELEDADEVIKEVGLEGKVNKDKVRLEDLLAMADEWFKQNQTELGAPFLHKKDYALA